MILGRLDQKVVLQRYERSQHATSGEYVETLTESRTVYAQLRGVSAKERFQGDRIMTADMSTMLCRYADASDVTTLWRVTDNNGKLWRITGNPREIGRAESLEFLLEAFV